VFCGREINKVNELAKKFNYNVDLQRNCVIILYSIIWTLLYSGILSILTITVFIVSNRVKFNINKNKVCRYVS